MSEISQERIQAGWILMPLQRGCCSSSSGCLRPFAHLFETVGGHADPTPKRPSIVPMCIATVGFDEYSGLI